MEGGYFMKKLLAAFSLACSLVLGLGLTSCDAVDPCHAECEEHDDCAEGYLCYSDGLCDNEDQDCEEEE
jgi:hypothetical protein